MTSDGIRWLDDLGAEIARVARDERTRSPASRARRIVAGTACALILLAGGFAVPATRAAIEDVTSTFAGWIEGDDSHGPGRSLPPGDNAPPWVRDEGGRLIAESHGVALYASKVTLRAGAGLRLTFGGGAIWDTFDGWRKRFDEHAVVVLGTAPAAPHELVDEHGRYPLMGVTARPVTTIEVRYAYGPPLDATGIDGGFVLFVDSRRPLRQLIAYDAAGHQLERTDVSQFTSRLAEHG